MAAGRTRSAGRFGSALAKPEMAASYTVLRQAPGIEDPRLAELLAYWRGRRRGRSIPAFADIDPIDIPSLLSYLWIHDYDPDADRFHCRLTGESVRSTYDFKVVGRDVEDIVGSAAYPVVSERYRAVLTIPAVAHGTGRIYGHTIGRVGVGERLYLPLADDEGRARMIIGATIYRVSADPPPRSEPDDGVRPDTMTPATAL